MPDIIDRLTLREKERDMSLSLRNSYGREHRLSAGHWNCLAIDSNLLAVHWINELKDKHMNEIGIVNGSQ